LDAKQLPQVQVLQELILKYAGEQKLGELHNENVAVHF
jgi:hypothetical protein